MVSPASQSLLVFSFPQCRVSYNMQYCLCMHVHMKVSGLWCSAVLCAKSRVCLSDFSKSTILCWIVAVSIVYSFDMLRVCEVSNHRLTNQSLDSPALPNREGILKAHDLAWCIVDNSNAVWVNADTVTTFITVFSLWQFGNMMTRKPSWFFLYFEDHFLILLDL